MVHPLLRPGQLPAVVEAALREAQWRGIGFVYLGTCQERRVGNSAVWPHEPGLRDLELAVAASRCLHGYALQRRFAVSLESHKFNMVAASAGPLLQGIVAQPNPTVSLPGPFGPVLRRALAVGLNIKYWASPSYRGVIFPAEGVWSQPPARQQLMSSCPISWTPTGGIGNLMYGYASLWAIAKRVGASHHINRTCTEGRNADEFCVFADRFKLPVGDFPQSCEPIRVQQTESFSGRFDPSLFGVRGGSFVGGHLRSWKYFEGYEAKALFAASPVAQERARCRAKALLRHAGVASSAGPTVCMQVRRGDEAPFGKDEDVQQDVLPGAAWYEAARDMALEGLAEAGINTSGATFIATLSSPADRIWAAQAFGAWSRPVVLTRASDAFRDFELLQSACEALVLGTSTFGWWAAFSSSAARVVVAPRSPYNMDHADVDSFRAEDYYPPGWILL